MEEREKKQQLNVKVDNDVLEQFNTTADLLLQTKAIKTKGDAVKYLLEQVSMKQLLENNEWQEEIQSMTHYSDMIAKLFQAVITKTKTQRDVFEAQKKLELQELHNKLAEEENFTKSFKEQLKQRDQLIGEQTRHIAEVEKKLEEKAIDYDNLQTQYKSVHTLFEEANENRQQVLVEKERHIAILNSQLQELEQELTNVLAALKVSQGQIEMQQGEFDTKLKEIQSDAATKIEEQRQAYEMKLNEHLTDAASKMEAQRQAYEEKLEFQRESLQSKTEAVREAAGAAQAALRQELEEKYEQRLSEAQKVIQELTAAISKEETLRKIAEEELEDAQRRNRSPFE